MELIVVIAIMAIMIGIIGFSLSYLFGVEAGQAAQKISSQLNETKTGAMSRYDETMTLSYKDKDVDNAIPSDGYYVERKNWTIANTEALIKENTGSESRKVASTRVSITLYLSDRTTMLLGTTNSVTISYDRATGAMDDIVINGAKKTGVCVSKIELSSGIKQHTIVFVPETGKHTIQ